MALPDIRGFERHLQQRMDEARVPGLALAVLQNDQVIYARGFGLTGIEDGATPVTPETLFRIGSTTKPMVGSVIMRMVDAGALALDRPIREYLPRLEMHSATAARTITLRMLMSHTAGLPTEYSVYGPRHPHALAESLRSELPRYRLLAEPGALFTYSNPGARLAAHVAEVVSGRHLAELLDEQLFRPLGLQRTTVDPMVAMTYPLALPHEPGPDGRLRVVHRFADHASRYAAGGVMSTVLDLLQFARLHLADGSWDGRQLLSRDSVAEMRRPQSDPHQPDGRRYGLFFEIDRYRGWTLVGHNGRTHEFGSFLRFCPESGVAVALLLNWIPRFLPAAFEIQRLLFDALLPAPGPNIGAKSRLEADPPWAEMAGVYLEPYEGLLRVEADASGHRVMWRGTPLVLTPARDQVWETHRPDDTPGPALGVPTGQEAPFRYLMLDGVPCRRLEPKPMDSSRLSALAGLYQGVSGTVRLRAQGEILLATLNGLPIAELQPIDEDAFASPFGLVLVERHPDGHATGLWLAYREHLRRVARGEPLSGAETVPG